MLLLDCKESVEKSETHWLQVYWLPEPAYRYCQASYCALHNRHYGRLISVEKRCVKLLENGLFIRSL